MNPVEKFFEAVGNLSMASGRFVLKKASIETVPGVTPFKYYRATGSPRERATKKLSMVRKELVQDQRQLRMIRRKQKKGLLDKEVFWLYPGGSIKSVPGTHLTREIHVLKNIQKRLKVEIKRLP